MNCLANRRKLEKTKLNPVQPSSKRSGKKKAQAAAVADSDAEDLGGPVGAIVDGADDSDVDGAEENFDA